MGIISASYARRKGQGFVVNERSHGVHDKSIHDNINCKC